MEAIPGTHVNLQLSTVSLLVSIEDKSILQPNLLALDDL